MKPENITCPECNGPMVSRTGQYGVFWGCKLYPQCRGTRDSMGQSRQEREEAKADAEECDSLAPHHYGRWDR